MSLFQPAPPPPTKLGVLRVLSPNAGVHVSPICLGGMSIGDKWSDLFGSMDKDSSFKLLDAYYDMGGNFIDTANNYQDESSEQFLGEWMEKRGIRDQIVLATKNRRHLTKDNFQGISDTPAWIVSQANEYARSNGKTPFVVYQGLWNILDRSFERDIIPMARSLGLALAPWGVLGQGKLRTDAEEQRRKESGENGRTDAILGPSWQRNEAETKVSRALEKVAGELGLGSNIGAVAIAYVLQKAPYVFPIIGGRKIEHLQENIKALGISLSVEQVQFLESIVPFDPGFPHNLLGDGSKPFLGMLNAMSYKKVPVQQPIKPTD
ncbi:hypothetical protein HHX47_DHR9000145 [Lentinula edodes]|nr:hypothetical protein HHX47_DHR9000145 [Lentinula edodes]